MESYDTSRTRRGLPGALPSGIRLLDTDPDLGAALSPEEFNLARRQVAVPTIGLARGPWRAERIADEPGVQGSAFGFLIITGAVTVDLSIAGRTCTRLIIPRELVLLDGPVEDSIPALWGWSVLEPTVVAVFDDRLLTIAQRWPGLLAGVLRRSAQQVRHALLQQAISQLPRVEDRLLALLWSIADRRGTVGRDGVSVYLPVTHGTLAQMIGARRPTVSLGLRNLVGQGLITPGEDGWVLDPASADTLPAPRLNAPASTSSGEGEDETRRVDVVEFEPFEDRQSGSG